MLLIVRCTEWPISWIEGEQGVMSKYYKVKKLMDDVYCIRNSFVNTILAVGKSRALLFDTGFGFADLKKAVEEITELPLTVVASHGHNDHIGGNWLFDEPIYIHEKDLEPAGRHGSPSYRAFAYDSIKKFQRILFWLPCLPRGLSREDYAGTETFNNYKTIREGELFDLGGFTLEVVELPGHTPGSIGLYCREKKLMLTSDAINETVYLFLPESTSLDTYIQSLKHAMAFDFDTFINGHVERLYPKSRIERYLDVAENLDFEHGRTHANTDFFCPGIEVRDCFKKGVHPKNGEPYIAISKEKLNQK